MKVYALYTGCKFEGGGVRDLYSTQKKAIDAALERLEVEKEETIKVHGEEAEKWQWQEVERQPFWSNDIVKIWQNPVDEIIVYEYDVK